MSLLWDSDDVITHPRHRHDLIPDALGTVSVGWLMFWGDELKNSNYVWERLENSGEQCVLGAIITQSKPVTHLPAEAPPLLYKRTSSAGRFHPISLWFQTVTFICRSGWPPRRGTRIPDCLLLSTGTPSLHQWLDLIIRKLSPLCSLAVMGPLPGSTRGTVHTRGTSNFDYIDSNCRTGIGNFVEIHHTSS